jgi:hypothetical protein
MLLALERRRIAHPKAHDYVDFQNEITAGIYDRRNGVLGLLCRAKIQSPMSPLGLGCFKTFCHERSELGEVAA